MERDWGREKKELTYGVGSRARGSLYGEPELPGLWTNRYLSGEAEVTIGTIRPMHLSLFPFHHHCDNSAAANTADIRGLGALWPRHGLHHICRHPLSKGSSSPTGLHCAVVTTWPIWFLRRLCRGIHSPTGHFLDILTFTQRKADGWPWAQSSGPSESNYIFWVSVDRVCMRLLLFANALLILDVWSSKSVYGHL